MRSVNKSFQSCLFLLALFALSSTPAWSQAETTVKKKVVIIKKTIDEEGNEKIEKIIKEGSDADEYLGNEEIEINIDDGEGGKIIRIKNEDGTEEEINIEEFEKGNEGQGQMRIRIKKDGEDFEWNGTEMDEEIMEQLENMEIDVDIDNFEGHRMIMINDEEVDRPMLGVHIENAGNNGALITNVIKGSGAAKAGLVEGDIITKINRSKITDIESLLAALKPLENGDRVKIRYLRDGKKEKTKATLTAIARDRAMNSNNSCNPRNQWKNKECIIKKKSGNQNIQKKSKQVIVIEKNGDQSNVITEDVIVTPPAIGLGELEIFPNPAQGKVNILFSADPVPTTIKVLSLNGSILFEEHIEQFDGRFAKEVDLGRDHKGGVMLQILQGDEIFTEKILNN